MKNIFLALLLLPFITIAQTAHTNKTVPKKPVAAAPYDGFIINGYIKGLANGTPVSFVNPQSGATEQTTTISNERFVLKGKMATTDFRVLIFNNQPPYITLFLDNSNVKITGTKDSLNWVVIKGSSTQGDFQSFNNAIEPYQFLFAPDAPYDSAATSKAMNICESFVMTHTRSLVAPLAVIRFMQLSDDNKTTERLYGFMSTEVQNSPYGKYITQQLAEAEQNGVGTVLPDFTQADTAGNPVRLSSFRGKYVLVDFWASWCHPCRMENPNVVAAYNKFKDKNFTVLSVSLDQSKDAWINAINMDNLTWTHVSDLQGWHNAVAQQFGIQQIPQNLLLDPNGVVIGKNLRGTALDNKLSRVLR